MYSVLLVDDENRVLNDLEQQVNWKDLGVRRLFKAASVRQALALYDDHHPDLIVSDMEMLQESGLDLLRTLREKDEDVLFLFLTCHPEFNYMQRAMQLGSCDYLLKPVDYRDLENALLRQLRRIEQKKQKDRDSSEDSLPIRGNEDLAYAAQKYIGDHIIEKIKVSDIAETLGVSEAHLMKSFKKETGWSVIEYITKKRVEMAGNLLKSTDWSVQMIANMCGYDDGQYFSRVFKKATGESPTEYQRRHRQAGVRL